MLSGEKDVCSVIHDNIRDYVHIEVCHVVNIIIVESDVIMLNSIVDNIEQNTQQDIL